MAGPVPKSKRKLDKPKPLAKKFIFASEYLKDRNGTRAAVRAGYEARSAHTTASRLLTDAEVQAFIAKNTAEVVEENKTTVARVLKEVECIAYADVEKMFDDNGALLPISQIPEDLRRAIAGFEVIETFEWEGEGPNRRRVFSGYLKKVKLVSKEGMLTLSARHLGMLHDNVNVKVDSVVDLLELAEKNIQKAGE